MGVVVIGFLVGVGWVPVDAQAVHFVFFEDVLVVPVARSVFRHGLVRC